MIASRTSRRYLYICCWASHAFAVNPLEGPRKGYERSFAEVQIFSHEHLLADCLAALVHPPLSARKKAYEKSLPIGHNGSK